MGGFTRDVYNELTDYLAQQLQNISGDVAKNWIDYQKAPDGSAKEYQIYKSLQSQLPPQTPTIEVVYIRSTNKIFSIGTQEEEFFYEFIVTTSNNHPVFSTELNVLVAKAVFSYLNAFENRAFTVPTVVPNPTACIYFSEASELNLNFRRGKGLISAKLSWTAKMIKPNRQSLTIVKTS